MLKRDEGFTLIEMLIVLAIISLLIILIVPNLGSKSEEVNKKGCDALKHVIQSQTNAYYIDEGEYPSFVDDLVDDYITSEQKTCKNGTEFSIDSNGKVHTKGKK